MDVENTWAGKEFSALKFNDSRLDRRLVLLANRLSDCPEQVISRACPTIGEAKAAYRFFDNGKVSPRKMLSAHSEKTIERALELGESHVYAIQDTSFFTYDHHPKTKGLGQIGKGGQQAGCEGLILHNTFIVTKQGVPLGFTDSQLWARKGEPIGREASRARVSIKQKESFKWIKALRASLKRIDDRVRVTSICDCEADIIEFLHEHRRLKADFIVRSVHDRLLRKEEKKLWSYLSTAETLGKVEIELPSSGNRASRKALLTVQASQITIKAPCGKSELGDLSAFGLLIREEKSSEQEPLEWLLLTSHEVKDIEQACTIMRAYRLRWRIESFHKILKSGFSAQDCRLQTGMRLKRFLTLQSIISWRMYWIVLAAREISEQSCESIFSKDEWKPLYLKVQRSNAFPEQPPTVREVIRMIARLGGFLGRKNDGEPGIQTIWRGWQRFMDLVDMWEMLRHTATSG